VILRFRSRLRHVGCTGKPAVRTEVPLLERKPIWALALLCLLGMAAATEGSPSKLILRSESFHDGELIPKNFTGEGANDIPSLTWTGIPPGTRELALIVEDPDAPGEEPFSHWVVYKIRPDTLRLPAPPPKRMVEGKNSFGKIGYDGPMPPKGDKPHRYYFKLYALDKNLDLGPGATRDQLLTAMKGHVLAEAQTIGRYQRK